MTHADLLAEILERRKSIRWHRDQKGDDRCHWDDYGVWRWLEGTPPVPRKLSSFEAELIRCKQFYGFRRADKPDRVPPDMIEDPRHWDDDLRRMSSDKLLNELAKIQEAIYQHCFVGYRIRTLNDDRKLYAVLPEKVPVNAVLPAWECFIGDEGTPNAGCPSFIRSHGTCRGLCNLNQWGPCT